MNEIRLTIRAHNNRLVRLREDLGMSARQAAEAIGVSYGLLIDLEAFRVSPLSSCGDNDEWKDSARKIAEFHGVGPDYIWPESVRELRARVARTTTSAAAVLGSLAWDSWVSGKPKMLECDRVKVDEIVSTLNPREQKVLAKRFGLDGCGEHTLKETGAEIGGVCSERARGIEAKALKKLRHPQRVHQVIELVRDGFDE